METLERHATSNLKGDICELLQEQDQPDTLETILEKLRKTRFVYKHDIARTIWQLANEGRIAVKSGRIAIQR